MNRAKIRAKDIVSYWIRSGNQVKDLFDNNNIRKAIENYEQYFGVKVLPEVATHIKNMVAASRMLFI